MPLDATRDARLDGLPKVAVVYRMTETSEGTPLWEGYRRDELPPENRFRDIAQNRCVGKLTLVDLERVPLDRVWHDATDGEVEYYHDQFKFILQTMQDEVGHSLNIGLYAGLKPLIGRLMLASNIAEIRQAMGRARVGRDEQGRFEAVGLADVCSVMFLPLYCRYDATIEQWTERTELSIELARTHQKPVYPLVCPRFMPIHDDKSLHMRYVGDAWWQAMIDVCKSLGTTPVVWDWSRAEVERVLAAFRIAATIDPMSDAEHERVKAIL